jgi:hypothetical protein
MGKSISFGMTRDEVLAVLFPDGVQDGDVQGFGLDGGGIGVDVWDYGSFYFNRNDDLYEFWTGTMGTARGIFSGNDADRMIELYSSEYKRYDHDVYGGYMDIFICEYGFGEYYLRFNIDRETEKISSWEVSRYSYEEAIRAAEQYEKEHIYVAGAAALVDNRLRAASFAGGDTGRGGG